MEIRIAFDAAKDGLNIEKHGVSLEAARYFEWDEAVSWVDTRKEYGEIRVCSIGYIRRRLHCLVYVERGEQLRIISLRKANMREEKRYAET